MKKMLMDTEFVFEVVSVSDTLVEIKYSNKQNSSTEVCSMSVGETITLVVPDCAVAIDGEPKWIIKARKLGKEFKSIFLSQRG